MRFVCAKCQANYSIANERVKGKILKIRCKKCALVITVREPAIEQSVIDLSSEWFVVVDAEQIGPLSRAELDARYARGEIDDETFIWADGMSDWVEYAMIFGSPSKPKPEPPQPRLLGTTETSGARVQEEASAIDVMGRRKRVDPRTRWPVDFSGHGAAIREEMQQIISRCIDPRPGMGFGSFEELERALERLRRS